MAMHRQAINDFIPQLRSLFWQVAMNSKAIQYEYNIMDILITWELSTKYVVYHVATQQN